MRSPPRRQTVRNSTSSGMYQTARRLVEQGLIDHDIPTPSRNPGAHQIDNVGEESTPNSEDDGNGRFFKTRMCLFHQKGACVKGETCTYAHNENELRQTPDLVRTRLCQDWLNGRCTAEKCKFAHGRQELRFTRDYYKTKLCHFWQQGGCTKGDLCRHAHGSEELRPVTTPILSTGLPSGGLSSTHDLSVHEDLLLDEEIDAVEDYQCIPSPTLRKNGPASSAAVLQALRLAERARLLVVRSTELLNNAGYNDAAYLTPSSAACDYAKLSGAEMQYPRSSVSSTAAPSSHEGNSYCKTPDAFEDLTETLARLLAGDNAQAAGEKGFNSSPYERTTPYLSTESLDDLCALIKEASL